MTADTKPEAEALCARCNYPRREHAYNGACYGLCSEFVTRAALSKPSVAADDEALIERVVKTTRPRIDTPAAAASFEALRRHIAGLRAEANVVNPPEAIRKLLSQLAEATARAEAALAACQNELRHWELGIRALKSTENGNG